MAVNIDLRPPYPNMDPNEVHQFQERIYKAILALEAVVTPISPTPETTDHNDISNNGGDNSHTSITLHMALKKAHGVISDIMGISDSQTVTNKVIDATNNTISNLRHGTEVDDLNVAHGISSEIVGTDEEQTIINKVIDADGNTITNLRHGNEVDNPTSDVHGVTGYLVGTTDVQTVTNKKIIRKVTPVLTSPFLAHTGDDYLSCQIAGQVTLPDDALPGETITVENSSNDYVTVTSPLLRIQGEAAQRVPPNSGMTICLSEIEWRIV